jgi:predicted AAA+ superfamily ATPase
LLNLKASEIPLHYTRSGLFESLVISDIAKSYYNHALIPRLYFWQAVKGHEIDCIIDEGLKLIPIEIKSGQTIQSSFFDNLAKWKELSAAEENAYLVYGGNENQVRTGATVVSWNSVGSIVEQEVIRE